MNRPEPADEPSMDEILASIRKIIADEPARAPGEVERPLPRFAIPTRDPLVNAAARPDTAATAEALAARLDQVFGAGAAPLSAPAPKPAYASAPRPSPAPGAAGLAATDLGPAPPAASLAAQGTPAGSSAARAIVDDGLDDLLEAPVPVPARGERSGIAPARPLAPLATPIGERVPPPFSSTELRRAPETLSPQPQVIAAMPVTAPPATGMPPLSGPALSGPPLTAPPSSIPAAPLSPGPAALSAVSEAGKPQPVVIAAMPAPGAANPFQRPIPVPRTVELNSLPAAAKVPPAAVDTARLSEPSREPLSRATLPLQPIVPVSPAAIAAEATALTAEPLVPVARSAPTVPDDNAQILQDPADLGSDLAPATPSAVASDTPPIDPPVSVIETVERAGDDSAGVAEADMAFTAPAALPEPLWVPSPAPVMAAVAPKPIGAPPSPPSTAALAIGLDQSVPLPDAPAVVALVESTGDAVAEPAPEVVSSALEALAARLANPADGAAPEIVVTSVEVADVAAGAAPPDSSTAAPGDAPGTLPAAPSTAVSVFSSPASFVGSAGSTALSMRSLEDTAAELLRPMLRHWLDENMPRIVEKALRIELAEPSSPQGKPSSSSS